MKKIITIIGLLVAGSLYSQDYQYQADVKGNTDKEFYQIPLNPNVLGKLNTNFSDLRLMDKAGEEVPYYIDEEEFSVTKRVFKEYKLVEKIKWRNGATVLFIENTDTAMINNIQVQIKNFDVRKRLELAGSDDYREWYTIKENYVFRSANGINTTSEVKSLNFPYCDYRYYRIIIYDWYSLPINILKIGYYDTYQEKGKFNTVSIPSMYRIDSNKVNQTYIKLKFTYKPYFDKLIFKVEKPEYFYRKAQLAIKKKDYKGREYFEPLTNFILNSNSDLTVYQQSFPYQEFWLIIDNEDNPPLEGLEVEAFQLKHRLITHLESDKKYTLVFGNEKIVRAPNYDLAFFKHKVGENIPLLKVSDVRPYKKEIVEHEEKKAEYWIWITVAGIALLLGLVSYKMIMEMEKK